MTEVITKHMLIKRLQQLQRETSTPVGSLSSGNTSTPREERVETRTVLGVTLAMKKITKIQKNQFIAEDGTKAKLLSPLPLLSWEIYGVATSSGTMVLKQPLKALIISDGINNNYCIGFDGKTDEFEVRLTSGKSNFTINNNLISIASDCLLLQGVEQK